MWGVHLSHLERKRFQNYSVYSRYSMCIPAIIQFMRESVETYKVTKMRRLSQFMNLPAMEGVLYFRAYVFSLFRVPSVPPDTQDKCG